MTVSFGLRATIVAFSAVVVFVTAIVVTLDVDVSAARYVRNDLLLRSAEGVEPLPYRFLDASPWAVWVPSNIHVHRAYRRGDLPIWDRRQGGGFSPLENFHNGVFFPLRALTAIFPERQAPTLLALWSLSLAFLGTVLLARFIGAGSTGSFVAGGVYAASPHMLSVLPIDFTAVLLFAPWLLLAALAFIEAPTSRRFLATALLSGLSFTAGHPSMVFWIHCLVGIAVLVHAVARRDRWRALGGLAVAELFGALFALPVLVPFLRKLSTGWTYKTGTGETAGLRAFEWGEWFEALRSMALGGFDEPMVDHARFYAYAGPLVLALVLSWLVCARRWPRARFLLILVPFTLLLGLLPPPFEFLARVPLLGHLKPWYTYSGTMFCLALAAGLGASALLSRMRRGVLRGTVSVALVLVATALGPIRSGALFSPNDRAWVPAGGGLGFLIAQEGPFRVMSLGGQVNAPNSSVLTGIEDLGLTGPLFDERYHQWFLAVDPRVLSNSYGTLRITHRIGSAFLGAFNVRYLLNGKVPFALLHSALAPMDPFAIVPPKRVSHPGWPLVYEDEWVQIFENHMSYKPRAYLSARARPVASAEEAFQMMRSARGSVVEDVVETEDAELGAMLVETSSSAGHVTVSYPSDTEAILDVNLTAAALVVLADAYHEGWSATIDGEPAPILPVNLLSRGVWVPAGAHRVRMSFSVPGLGASFFVSGLALLAALAFVVSRKKSAH